MALVHPPGLEPGDKFEGINELTHGIVLLLDLFAFPLDHDAITFGKQSIFLASGGFIHVMHGLVTHLVMRLVTVWETFGATVEFVHGVGTLAVPVYVEGFVSSQDHVYASIAGITNVDVEFSVQVR